MLPHDPPRRKRLIPDNRGRITLGELAHGVSSFEVHQEADGTIRLLPLVEIPAREQWLWNNRAALESVRQGMSEAARGELGALDLACLADDDEEEP